MTSNKACRYRWLAIAAVGGWVLPSGVAWAGLGESVAVIEQDRVAMHAQKALQVQSTYTVHVLQMANGGLVRQYASADQRVFAVSWVSVGKPDLATLLGPSYGRYVAGVRASVQQRPGAGRQFHHSAQDLVVHSSAHLNVFKGYAYHPSMLPAGFGLAAGNSE